MTQFCFVLFISPKASSPSKCSKALGRSEDFIELKSEWAWSCDIGIDAPGNMRKPRLVCGSPNTPYHTCVKTQLLETASS